MGVEMTDAEAWAFVESAHTGILTTLRADGSPVSVPIWFVVDEGAVLIAGPAATAKFRRVRADPRVCFLVESGSEWQELRSVRFEGNASVVDAPDWDRVDALIAHKYGGARADRSTMAESARRRYDEARALLRLAPRSVASWDNRKLVS